MMKRRSLGPSIGLRLGVFVCPEHERVSVPANEMTARMTVALGTNPASDVMTGIRPNWGRAA